MRIVMKNIMLFMALLLTSCSVDSVKTDLTELMSKSIVMTNDTNVMWQECDCSRLL